MSKLANVFEYSDVHFDHPHDGDEWYEVRVFRDGLEIEQNLDDWPTYPFPEAAIEAAQFVLDQDGGCLYDGAFVSVYGTKYPDGSPVPDGATIWRNE